jgi:RNA polymerase sigma-70 factor, ECF subfamily
MASQEITELIRRWGRGDTKAADHLFPMIYDELRRMARQYLRAEGPGHTLQPTALVHELYLKLARLGIDVQDRRHFYAIAARQMRHLLIDRARAARAEKRGGALARVDSAKIASPDGAAFEALALDEAITALEGLDARVAKVVELRYFAGLAEAEAAEALNISVATLKRDWQFAQTWLRARLRTKGRHDDK